MFYEGRDRRIHTCFVTQNREYHTRRGVCVAVRDRATHVWMARHEAVGLLMREIESGQEFLGQPLEFIVSDRLVRTSRVRDILRPGKNEVAMYPYVFGFAPVA